MRPAPSRVPAGPARADSPTAWRAVLVAAVLAGLAAALVVLATPAAAQEDAEVARARVDVVEVDGIIDRTITGYLLDRIRAAEEDDGDVLVLTLASAGGVGGGVPELVQAIDDSSVPVVVWAGPPGAQLSGAGMAIAQSAHVLATAPGTVLGPTAPYDLEDDEAQGGAAIEVEAAERRGRAVGPAQDLAAGQALVVAEPGQVDLAEVPSPYGLVEGQLRQIGAQQAVEDGVVDLVAASLPEVLADLGGREVRSGQDGTTEILEVDTATAELRFHSLGLLRQILHTVASPDLAYLLLTAGVLCMVFEVFQPGFGVAGVTGLVMAALGTFGLAALPVSWLAFAVLLAALAIMAVDLAVAGFGWATLTGTLGMLAGSFLLIPGPDLLRVSTWVIIGVVAFNITFFVVIMTNVLRTQGNQASAGAENLVGKQAVVRSMLNPEGHVFVEGALWRARAPEAAGKVSTGTVVRIVALDDRLTLEVEVPGVAAPASDAQPTR